MAQIDPDDVVGSEGVDGIRRYEVEVHADLGELASGRVAMDEWLASHRTVSSKQAEEMTLVFVELLANAIEASRPVDSISYSFAVTDDEVVVRVENPNPFGQSVELRTMPVPTAEGGRGLALAQQLSDRVDVERMGGSVSISAHFFHRGD